MRLSIREIITRVRGGGARHDEPGRCDSGGSTRTRIAGVFDGGHEREAGAFGTAFGTALGPGPGRSSEHPTDHEHADRGVEEVDQAGEDPGSMRLGGANPVSDLALRGPAQHGVRGRRGDHRDEEENERIRRHVGAMLASALTRAAAQ